MKFILNENQIANETQVAQSITLMLQIELTKAGLNNLYDKVNLTWFEEY